MNSCLGWFLALLVVACSCISARAQEPPPTSKRQAAAEWSADGLRRIEVKGVDVVYVRPDSNLAPYTRVWIRPISVSFRRDWGRSAQAGLGGRVRPSDAERIKGKLAALVRDELVRQLAEGGYELAEGPGDDVLDVQLSITDLYVNAPDLNTPNRVVVYAVSAGEMTLIAELRDSVSGEVLTRVYDHAQAHESFRPERITSVDNVAEAQAATRTWAEALRHALELARSPAPAP